MRANPLDKDASARETDPLRRLFTRSVVARRPLARGTVLSHDDLALKKPGTGLPPDRLPDLVGKRLARAVAEDQLLAVEDVEGMQ
jgi:N-acetylneuraminate synthase